MIFIFSTNDLKINEGWPCFSSANKSSSSFQKQFQSFSFDRSFSFRRNCSFLWATFLLQTTNYQTSSHEQWPRFLDLKNTVQKLNCCNKYLDIYSTFDNKLLLSSWVVWLQTADNLSITVGSKLHNIHTERLYCWTGHASYDNIPTRRSTFLSSIVLSSIRTLYVYIDINTFVIIIMCGHPLLGHLLMR